MSNHDPNHPWRKYDAIPRDKRNVKKVRTMEDLIAYIESVARKEARK